MTANATGSQSIDRIGAAQSASIIPGTPHAPDNGLSVGSAAAQLSAFNSRGRAPGTLVAHAAGGLEEWSASGAVRIDPGPSRRGLSLTLAPSLGAPSGGAGRLWSEGAPEQLMAAGAGAVGGRLDGELGYGLRAPDRRGVITPYAGLSLTNDGRRTERVGARWAVTPDVTLGLETSRNRRRGVRPDHALVFRAVARW